MTSRSKATGASHPLRDHLVVSNCIVLVGQNRTLAEETESSPSLLGSECFKARRLARAVEGKLLLDPSFLLNGLDHMRGETPELHLAG